MSVMKKREISINVNFFLLHALGLQKIPTCDRNFCCFIWGFQENTPTETNVLIQGIAMTVYASSNHFEYVDLMGRRDFMVVAIRRGLVTVVDYPCKIVIIQIK